jgi:polyhydroxyalkanoate synthesis regulator phasin
LPKAKEKTATLKRESGPKDLTALVDEIYNAQYVQYAVEARILNKIVGGTSRRLETTFAMIDSRVKAGKITEEEAEDIKSEVVKRYDEMRKKHSAHDKVSNDAGSAEDPEALSSAASALESNWNSFWADEHGLYIETRTIKAAIRSSLSALNVFTENVRLRKRVGHNDGTYVEGIGPHIDRIYLERAGKPITEPDDYEDRVVLLKTKQGPMSALKRVDVVWGDNMGSPAAKGGSPPYECVLRWRYKVLKSCSLTEEDILKGMALLQDRGLGAMTSQGFGRFKLSAFERL